MSSLGLLHPGSDENILMLNEINNSIKLEVKKKAFCNFTLIKRGLEESMILWWNAKPSGQHEKIRLKCLSFQLLIVQKSHLALKRKYSPCWLQSRDVLVAPLKIALMGGRRELVTIFSLHFPEEGLILIEIFMTWWKMKRDN